MVEVLKFGQVFQLVVKDKTDLPLYRIFLLLSIAIKMDQSRLVLKELVQNSRVSSGGNEELDLNVVSQDVFDTPNKLRTVFGVAFIKSVKYANDATFKASAGRGENVAKIRRVFCKLFS